MRMGRRILAGCPGPEVGVRPFPSGRLYSAVAEASIMIIRCGQAMLKWYLFRVKTNVMFIYIGIYRYICVQLRFRAVVTFKPLYTFREKSTCSLIENIEEIFTRITMS